MDLICRVCLEEVGTDNWVCLFIARHNKQLFSNILREFASIEVIQNDQMPKKICNKCSVALVEASEFKKRVKISDCKLRWKISAEKISQIDLSLVKVEDNKINFEGSSVPTENSFLADINECESIDSSIQFENNNDKTIHTDQMSLKQLNDPVIDEALDIFDNERNGKVIGNIPELHIINENVGENIDGNSLLRSLLERNDYCEEVSLKNEDLPQINIVESVMSQNTFSNNDNLMLPKLVAISNEDESQLNIAHSIVPRNIFPNNNKVFLIKFVPISNEDVSQINVAQSMPQNMFQNNDNLVLPKLLPISESTAPKFEFKSPDNDDYDPFNSTFKINNRTVYRCKDCNKTFTIKRRYIIHLNSHLGIRLYPCKVCKKSFSYDRALKEHNYIHTGEKPYACKMCDKMFRTGSSLRSHERTHFDEKPYYCDRCGKNFRQLSGLKAHIAHVHTQERRFICEVCSTRFKDPSTLKGHTQTVHSTERNYTCSTCEKKYKTMCALNQHQKSHLGLKPHKCEVCRKGFGTSTSLKIHMRIHQGVKPYPCKVCNKAFRQAKTLKLHMRSHSGETPFHCTFCEKKYGYKHHLNNHIKKYHEDPQN